MKNKILFMLLLLFTCMMQAKAYDCYYENISGNKKTVVGYNIGGSLTIETFKGKSVNLTASSSDNKSSYSLDKCYDYVGVAVKKNKQGTGYQISYKLGTSSDEVSFASNNDYAVMKKTTEPTKSTKTNTNTSNTSTEQENLEIVDVKICDPNDSNNALVVFRAIGFIIIFIKILVPVILIVLGSIEIGKAAISSDDKALNSAIINFAKKVLIGLIIFFIPTILDLLLGLVGGVSDTADKYETCTNCVLHPNQGSKCPIAENWGEGFGGQSGGGGAGRK